MKYFGHLKTLSLCLLSFAILPKSAAQPQDTLWQDTSLSPILSGQSSGQKNVQENSYRTLRLDKAALLERIAEKNTINVPLPDGEFIEIKLTPTTILPASLAAKYPSIKTFMGVQLDHPENYGRFDLTEHGFHGVLNFNGESIYIDPKEQGNNEVYVSYYKRDARSSSSVIEQKVLRVLGKEELFARKSVQQSQINKIYRIAFSTTGEYSTFHGGTTESTLAAITTMVNRINLVFTVDLGITFQIAENLDRVIYLDAESDPFLNTDEDVYNNPQVLREQLGIDTFDIGHVLTTGAGGLAIVAATCDDGSYTDGNVSYYPIKAMGVTGSETPLNDSFYIDFVAHELGHQLGAEHTFNAQSSSCSGSNRTFYSAYEPGSGSTIMAYTGICAPENIQDKSDAYFHVASIEQMTNYLTNDVYNVGQSCGQPIDTSNNAPEIDGGLDYDIPANTPFELNAQGSDIDNDLLTFTWEQFDLGPASNSLETMKDDGLKPLFRSFKPSTATNRIYPTFSSILSGELIPGENFATTTRLLNFKVSVRDQKGAIATDLVTLSVDGNSGPFKVIKPGLNEPWFSGNEVNIVWDVANTDLTPVSCPSVDIDLSIDEGQSFSESIARNVENSGAFVLLAPNVSYTNSRIKVSCNNNVFFAISEAFNIETNIKPEAVNDIYTVAFESESTFDVLSNDSDADKEDIITLVAVDYQGSGSTEISDNQLRYTAGLGFSGIESLTYTIRDSKGAVANASISIIVQEKVKSKSSSGSVGYFLSLLSLLLFIRRRKIKL